MFVASPTIQRTARTAPVVPSNRAAVDVDLHPRILGSITASWTITHRNSGGYGDWNELRCNRVEYGLGHAIIGATDVMISEAIRRARTRSAGPTPAMAVVRARTGYALHALLGRKLLLPRTPGDTRPLTPLDLEAVVRPASSVMVWGAESIDAGVVALVDGDRVYVLEPFSHRS